MFLLHFYFGHFSCSACSQAYVSDVCSKDAVKPNNTTHTFCHVTDAHSMSAVFFSPTIDTSVNPVVRCPPRLSLCVQEASVPCRDTLLNARFTSDTSLPNTSHYPQELMTGTFW